MKQPPDIPRVFDLAAMRGWRIVRLDRTATPSSQRNKGYAPEHIQLPKAA